MKITVQSSNVVTPSCSGGRRPSADPEAVPLTVFDEVKCDHYVYGLYFFRPPAPPSSALVAGLAAALAEYPEWAGRLGSDSRGNRAILLNGAGAWFVEATADVPLDSVMPLEPATCETQSLHPSGEDDAVDDELLLVQVTRFTCGSFIVGTAAQRVVADGLALRSLVSAWGQATRGAAIDRVVAIEYSWQQPRMETQAAGNKSGKNLEEKQLVMHRVNLSREFIAELKKWASVGAPRPYGTLQCVAAHLWRCVTKARRLDGRTGTQLRISVNGHLRRPGVTTTAGELVRRPLGQVVDLVSKALAAAMGDDAYFRLEEEGQVPTADPLETTVLSPNAEVEILLGLPFQDFDFGGGPPFFFMPSYSPKEGIIFIVSSFSGDGSIDAYVPLFSQAMDVFKNCCHSPYPRQAKD